MTLIGFTRPAERLKDSVKEAEEMGFEVLAAPSMKIITGDKEEFRKAEEYLLSGKVSVSVFGSVTAVEECVKEYGDRFPELFLKTRIIAIGPSTDKALREAGLDSAAVPEEYSSEGIVSKLRDSVKGKTVILMRSDSGSDVLYNGLTEAGAEVISIAAYKLEPFGISGALLHLFTSIKGGKVDAMAFTSPRSAQIFYAQMEEQYGKEKTEKYMGGLKVAAIGKPTSGALRKLGREPDIVPENATFRDMLEAIRDSF